MFLSRLQSSGLSQLILVLGLVLGLVATPVNVPAQSTSDPVHQYNEACRLSLAGDQIAALEAFRLALAAGFDDIDFALEDPDLQRLRQEKGFLDLIISRRSTLQLMSSEKGLSLVSGQWTDPFALDTESEADEGSILPSMRLRWLPTGLDFELTLVNSWANLASDKIRAPWNGGPGLVLTLGIPEPATPFDTGSHFVMAFGLEKSSPVGAIYLERGGWQRILELDPTLRIDTRQNTTILTGTIPWQTIQPFHPLVDPRLGFNAALRVPSASGFSRAELFQDPRAFIPDSPRRRFVPLDFQTATETRESLVGKVDRSLSKGGPLGLALVAVSSEDGPGILTMDFTDNQQKSLLPAGPVRRSVQLSAGFNSLQQQADFSALKPGLYVARVEINFPSGRSAVWSTQVLQLGEDWLERFTDQVNQLPLNERRTGQYYLDILESAVTSSPARFNPGPIASTMGDLERILVRAMQTGTILPDSGTMVLVFAGPGDQDRLATLYLPEGFRQRGKTNPILLTAAVQGLEAPLVQRLGRSYDDPDHLGPERQTTPLSPIYIIPHFPSYTRDIQASFLAEVTAVLDWSLDYFEADQASLCGVDFFGGPALSLVHKQPDKIRALQIMAGGRLDPWPQATREFLANQLDPAPADIPVTWLDFSQETQASGQAPLLLEVLEQLGYQLEPIHSVRGGLSLSQVADRAVLWAESIP